MSRLTISIVHIASGNVYAAKAGRREKVNWDELDPKNYPWLGVLEHSAEHYGLLVRYYRDTGLLPPEFRPRNPASSGLDAHAAVTEARQYPGSPLQRLRIGEGEVERVGQAGHGGDQETDVDRFS